MHQLLAKWQDVAKELKSLKVQEMDMRKKLSKHFFPNPKEGTNTCDLGNEWKAKTNHKVNRKCDEAVFEAVFSRLPRGSKSSLIKFEPKLIVKAYKSLTDKERKIFDECLIISDGSPTLSVVPPKGV